jgi:hypothetical protein
MGLARRQDKVEEAASGITDADDLAAETAPRAPRSLRVIAGFAGKLQAHIVDLPGRAPAAFCCARATVPSMQAKPSFGSAAATTSAMILSQTPATDGRSRSLPQA